MPVACRVVSEIRVTKVQPPNPAALPRQQAQPAERWSATESTTAADVRRQRRMLAARFVAASVGCETVPTEVIGRPSVVIVVVTDGDGSESIAIRSVGNLTLGWDHRAFDGAYAAGFLVKVKQILETRDWNTEL